MMPWGRSLTPRLRGACEALVIGFVAFRFGHSYCFGLVGMWREFDSARWCQFDGRISRQWTRSGSGDFDHGGGLQRLEECRRHMERFRKQRLARHTDGPNSEFGYLQRTCFRD